MDKKKLSPANFIGVKSHNIISFGSGEPDLPPPNEVYTALSSYTNFKYGLIQGQENLRASLAEQYPKSTENSFVITNGASEALDLALRVIAKYESSLSKKVLITKPFYYSYPRIIEYSPQTTYISEGCLSFPGLFFPVERAYGISTEYYRKDGVQMSGTFVDISAKCFQHEYDHMLGKLYIDGASAYKIRNARKKQALWNRRKKINIR